MIRRSISLILLGALLISSGCFGNDESTLRKRSLKLINSLIDEDYDTGLTLLDPEKVAEQGEAQTKIQLGILALGFNFMQIDSDDVRIDEVIVSPGSDTATVKFSLRIGEEWGEPSEQTWIRVDNNWYIEMD